MRRIALLLLPASLASCAVNPAPPQADMTFAAIEQRSGGRLGVSLVGNGGEALLTYRENERFPTCSTFKTLLAAMVLDGAEEGRWSLYQAMVFSSSDVLDYAPYVKSRIGTGSVPVGDAAGAAVTLSDNSAANLLYRLIGGPESLRDWLRTGGDLATNPSRTEPGLNENLPGDLRDTTTPLAMARTVQRLVTGDRLSVSSRRTLEGWLRASETGTTRIRAGLPSAWTVGDKTGTCGGANPAFADVAVIRLSDGSAPYTLSVYLDRPAVGSAEADAAIADAARVAADRMIATR